MTEGSVGAGPTDEDVLAVAEAMYREAAVELHRTIEAIRGGLQRSAMLSEQALIDFAL
jgi:hypothetical protein